jgi:hypothetical protein
VTVLAHAGGVDEAVMIVLPLLLFGVFLLLERRARRREREAEPDKPVDPETS